jgi:uncharacterized membrane protein YhaH (DUF805 family)
MSAYSISYQGHINRTEFFNRTILATFVSLVSLLIARDASLEFIAYCLIAFSFIYRTQTWIRRAHDIGKSSYYAIWMFIPFANIAAWVNLQFKKGSENNKVIKSDDNVPAVVICFILFVGWIYIRSAVSNYNQEKNRENARQEAEYNELNKKRAEEAYQLYLQNKQSEEMAAKKIKLNATLAYHCIVSFDKECQLELFYAGYNPGVIDGVYGFQTMNAWNKCYRDNVCNTPAPAIY